MELIAWGLTTLVTAFVGSYLAGYLKKKGENLATHEDIDKLVEQVAAVTTASKKIEAQISDSVWNRQKRWEITKDALVESVGALSQITEALTLLDSTYRAASAMKDPNAAVWSARTTDALDEWSRASATFSRAMLLAELVCGQEVKNTLNALNLHVRNVAGDVLAGKLETFRNSVVQLLAHQTLLLAAIRKELGIESVLLRVD